MKKSTLHDVGGLSASNHTNPAAIAQGKVLSDGKTRSSLAKGSHNMTQEKMLEHIFQDKCEQPSKFISPITTEFVTERS